VIFNLRFKEEKLRSSRRVLLVLPGLNLWLKGIYISTAIFNTLVERLVKHYVVFKLLFSANDF
jgi:hypothetical protein